MVVFHAAQSLVELDMAVPAFLLIVGLTSVDRLEGERDHPPKLAPLIAIVGCDGSGKSTLSADMRATLAAEIPTEVCYLGLGSGEMGNRIRQWPLIGAPIEHALARKAKQTRSKGKTIPGLPTALVVFGFSLIRLHRFQRVLALRRKGVTVITDRYPQTEIAGFYDGPGLAAARAGSPVVALLARVERHIYEWMASFLPDVVLRLNVDAETALTRKPDHKPDLLREKVRVTPLLSFHGARIVDLDARGGYDSVRREAFARVEPILTHRDDFRVAA
jgi:thymidylate kinase